MPDYGNIDWEEQKQKREQQGMALPEPRRVKREIIWARNAAEDQILETVTAQHRSVKTCQELLKAVGKLYLKVRAYAERYNEKQSYKNLKQLEKILGGGGRIDQATPQDIERLVSIYYEIDDIIYDLGITDIGIKVDSSQPFGYDFLQGLSIQLNTKWAAWQRLKQNMRNVTKLLEDDADFLGLITSETSGLGKSTIMSALLEEMNEEQGRDWGEQNLVFTDDDFWEAFELPGRSTAGIDEGPRLLYSKDAMKGKQKERKKKIKTGRYNNIGLLVCMHDFYDLDNEMINTNVNFNIHLPSKGRFEFYSKAQVNNFEKDDNGKCVRPMQPVFAGHFPDYDGPMWDIYRENEYKKDEGIREVDDEQDKGDRLAEIVTAVKEDLDRYVKEWGDNKIINKDLLAADFDCGDDIAKRAKAKIEADIDELGR